MVEQQIAGDGVEIGAEILNAGLRPLDDTDESVLHEVTRHVLITQPAIEVAPQLGPMRREDERQVWLHEIGTRHPHHEYVWGRPLTWEETRSKIAGQTL
ncbi:hypothetical protein GCM10028812_16440 [Ancylobacter sonchi]